MAGSGPWNNRPVTITKIDTRHNPGTDFLDGRAPFPKSTANNPKFFEYAPYGKQTGMCVTEPRKGAQLVLQRCDGSLNQTWDAYQISGSSYYWLNEATGDAMTAGPKGGNLPAKPEGTKLTGAKYVGGKNQAWTATDGS